MIMHEYSHLYYVGAQSYVEVGNCASYGKHAHKHCRVVIRRGPLLQDCISSMTCRNYDGGGRILDSWEHPMQGMMV